MYTCTQMFGAISFRQAYNYYAKNTGVNMLARCC